MVYADSMTRTKNEIKRWPADSSGTILSGACVRTGDELNADTIRLALDEGWVYPDGERYIRELYEQEAGAGGTYWADDPELSEALSECTDLAVAWLNEHIAPEGYYFQFDEGLQLEAGNGE